MVTAYIMVKANTGEADRLKGEMEDIDGVAANWEEVDMDQATVLDYDNLSAEDLLYWQKRAFREWAFRPGPILTMLKSMNTWEGFKSAVDIGLQTLGWLRD